MDNVKNKIEEITSRASVNDHNQKVLDKRAYLHYQAFVRCEEGAELLKLWTDELMAMKPPMPDSQLQMLTGTENKVRKIHQMIDHYNKRRRPTT